MKKIKDFEKKDVLKKSRLSKLLGGKVQPIEQSYSSEILAGTNGCCQLVEITDTYTDCNNNGIWDPWENGTSTSVASEIDCPNP